MSGVMPAPWLSSDSPLLSHQCILNVQRRQAVHTIFAYHLISHCIVQLSSQSSRLCAYMAVKLHAMSLGRGEPPPGRPSESQPGSQAPYSYRGHPADQSYGAPRADDRWANGRQYADSHDR